MKPTFGTASEEIKTVAKWLDVPVPQTEREERALLYTVAKAIKYPVPQNLEQRNLLLKEVLKRGSDVMKVPRRARGEMSEQIPPEVIERYRARERAGKGPRLPGVKPPREMEYFAPRDPEHELLFEGQPYEQRRSLTAVPEWEKVQFPEEIQEQLGIKRPILEQHARRELVDSARYLIRKYPEKFTWEDFGFRNEEDVEEKISEDAKYWKQAFAKLDEVPSILSPEEVEELGLESEMEPIEKPELGTKDYQFAAEQRIGRSPKVARRFAQFLEGRGADLDPDSVDRELEEFQLEEAKARELGVKEDKDVDELVSDYDLDPSDAVARREAIEAGEKVAPLITLDEFRDEWVRFHGAPESDSDIKFLEGSGIKDFYSDYVTGTSNVQDYFRQIIAEADIKEELLSKSEHKEEIQDLLTAGYRPSELKGLSEDLLLKKYFAEFKEELNFLERVKKN